MKLKGISSCLHMLSLVLTGNYVNFAIMEYYQDQSLSIALNAGIKLIMNLPLKEALKYLDVSKYYFSFLQILFRNHCNMVETLDSSVIFGLLSSLHEGITGFNTQNSSLAASALDNLFTYRIELKHPNAKDNVITKKILKKSQHSLQLIEAHFDTQSGQMLVSEILNSMFNMVIFDRSPNLWSLARAIYEYHYLS